MPPSCPRTAPKRQRSRNANFALALAGALLPGCASYDVRPLFSSGAASSYIEHVHREGLHVAVIDLSAERSTEKHFARHLPDYEYVPVQLLVELDAHEEAAFDLRRENLSLVLQDGTRLAAVDPLDVAHEVSFSHWRSFFGFLFLIPGPFVASSVSSANEQLENDYLEKSLRSVRVSHNMRAYQGVVFFRLPEEANGQLDTEDAFVEVVVQREGVGAGELGRRIEFPVHFTR